MQTQYENSYRTELSEGKHFIAHQVKHIAETALQKRLASVEYNPTQFAALSCALTNVIKTSIRDQLEMPRSAELSGTYFGFLIRGVLRGGSLMEYLGTHVYSQKGPSFRGTI